MAYIYGFFGGRSTYHFRGTVQNGRIKASHYRGHTFNGKMLTETKASGVVTARNGLKFRLTARKRMPVSAGPATPSTSRQ